MRADEAMAIVAEDIPSILESAGLVNGETLDEDEIAKRDAPIFWPMKAESPDATGKRIFAVWKIQALEPLASAENDVECRRATAYIDFWIMGSPYAGAVKKAVARASRAFRKDGWEFELNSAPYYDSSSKRTQLSYVLTKTI